MATISLGRDSMKRKIISVSKKRQITIPLQFYKHLKLGSEVICSLENGKIVIEPLHREATDFSIEILKDLISQGYKEEELVKQFEIQSKNIRRAVTNILEETEKIAAGEKRLQALTTSLVQRIDGDLAGIYGFDVKYKGVSHEIAYAINKIDGKKVIVLLAGTRENFYEQLKRYIK